MEPPGDVRALFPELIEAAKAHKAGMNAVHAMADKWSQVADGIMSCDTLVIFVIGVLCGFLLLLALKK